MSRIDNALFVGLLITLAGITYLLNVQINQPHICYSPWYNGTQYICNRPRTITWVYCAKPQSRTWNGYPACNYNSIAPNPGWSPFPSNGEVDYRPSNLPFP